MPVVTPTAESYLAQFQQLLPRGRIWHRGWGTLQAQDLLTLMPTWVRLTLRANYLLVDSFPCTTNELLPEWEASLGLPDPCTGPLPTVQQRQAAVCAKFVARGGCSQQYFIDLAARLGYQITITQYAPFRASVNRAGDRVYSQDWAFVWRVTATISNLSITYFRASQSAAGEPLAWWGTTLLECVFNELKPAHTTIIFAYDIGGTIWDGGGTTWDDGATVWDYGG